MFRRLSVSSCVCLGRGSIPVICHRNLSFTQTLASDYVRHIPPNAINWYPGHMQKGLKEIQARLADVDVIIEIHDARLPLTGRCQFVRDVSQIRPHILILNKSDLAERIVDVTEHKRLFTEDQSLGPYFQPPAEIFFANLKHPERQKRLLRQLLSRCCLREHL
uniref:Mitochondrial GTPase 1 n=1 Tax=Mesocestoides corti TaxID=53468 RepID=A0A5K3FPG9_MESCO